MKKFAIAAVLLISIGASAQKDELKALKKIADKEAMPTPQEIQQYKALLDKAEPLMENATNEQKADFYYYKGGYAAVSIMLNPASTAKLLNQAVDNLDKTIELEKSGKKNHTKEIQEEIYPELKTAAITAATALSKQDKFKEASQLMHLAYRLDPNDKASLYNAAANAVNAQDLDAALSYYEELDKSDFTGESTAYGAKNAKTGAVEYFGSDKKARDLMVQQKLYTNPTELKQESVKGEIVKNIALIYIQKGDTAKAKQAMSSARKANPNDIGLLLAEADLYLKTNDTEMYRKLVTEASVKEPNNADLYYNLGVVAGKTDKAEAKKQFEKALSINPNHANANNNMGTLILADDQKIVDEMNSLGNTAKDNKRYDELKKKRDGMYRQALPYYEKVLKIEPENEYAIGMLSNLYQALDMQAEAKAMKAKIKK